MDPITARTPQLARRVVDRWSALPLVLRDGILAVTVAAIVMMASATSTVAIRPDSPWTTVAAGAVAVVVLSFRRRAPVAAWSASIVIALVASPLANEADAALIVLSFAAYSVIAHHPPAVPLQVGAATFVVAQAATLLQVASTGGLQPSTFLMPALSVPYACGLATVIRRNRDTAAVLAARNAELERLHGVEAREAVLAERGRIARELHDIVAHHVSGIVLQGKAARQLVRARPDDVDGVDRALADIVDNGTEALTSMRGLLGMLRQDGTVETAPQPTLADLPALVDQVAARGLPTTLEVVGSPPHEPVAGVPLDVQLSAYRIVQEALTNAVRHSRGRQASVRLTWEADRLGLTVDDNGVGARPGVQPGHGLVGMHERAALVGGDLHIGTSPSGGWRVHGVLPLP